MSGIRSLILEALKSSGDQVFSILADAIARKIVGDDAPAKPRRGRPPGKASAAKRPSGRLSPEEFADIKHRIGSLLAVTPAGMKRPDLIKAHDWPEGAVTRALQELRDEKAIQKFGDKKGTVYKLFGSAPPKPEKAERKPAKKSGAAKGTKKSSSTKASAKAKPTKKKGTAAKKGTRSKSTDGTSGATGSGETTIHQDSVASDAPEVTPQS